MGPNTFSEPWHLPCSPPEQITEIVCILVLKLTFCGPFTYLLSLLCSTFDSNNLFDLSIGSTIKIIFQENKYYPNYLKWCSKFGLFFVWYEDVFNRFVHEINTLAAYQWWEGSVYSILACPLAWSWQQCVGEINYRDFVNLFVLNMIIRAYSLAVHVHSMKASRSDLVSQKIQMPFLLVILVNFDMQIS